MARSSTQTRKQTQTHKAKLTVRHRPAAFPRAAFPRAAVALLIALMVSSTALLVSAASAHLLPLSLQAVLVRQKLLFRHDMTLRGWHEHIGGSTHNIALHVHPHHACLWLRHHLCTRVERHCLLAIPHHLHRRHAPGDLNLHGETSVRSTHLNAARLCHVCYVLCDGTSLHGLRKLLNRRGWEHTLLLCDRNGLAELLYHHWCVCCHSRHHIVHNDLNGLWVGGTQLNHLHGGGHGKLCWLLLLLSER